MNAAEARAIYEKSRAGRPQEAYRHAIRKIKEKAREGRCTVYCDPFVRQYVTEQLSAAGFDVVTAPSKTHIEISWVFDKPEPS